MLGKLLTGWKALMGSQFTGYLALALALAFGSLWALWRFEAGNARNAYETIAVMELNARSYENALRLCNNTVAEFQVEAERNMFLANAAIIRAQQAEDYVRIVRDQANRDIEAAKAEAEGFRNDEECRTLGDPLPDGFVDWVFNAEGSN